MGMVSVGDERSAQDKTHLGLGHAGLELRHHFLGNDIALLDIDFVRRKLFGNLVGHGTGGKKQNGDGSKCPQNGFHKNSGKKQESGGIITPRKRWKAKGKHYMIKSRKNFLTPNLPE